MPAYQSTPFKPPVRLLMPGLPEYVFGSFNDRVGATLGSIIDDSAVTTTGTVTFRILSGNIPVVGMLISVVGASNSANFNVKQVPILSVTGDPVTGIYTVTYTITSSTVGAHTPDSGSVAIQQVQTAEAVTGPVASIPVTASYNNPATEMGRAITGTVQFTNNPSVASITTLQGSNVDLDAEYSDVLTIGPGTGIVDNKVYSATTGQGTAASAGAVNLPNYRFWRIKHAGAFSANTVVSKIMD